MSKGRHGLFVVGMFIVLAAGAFGLVWIRNNIPVGLRSKVRKEWKDRAVQSIAGRLSNPSWLAAETNKLHSKINSGVRFESWLSPGLVLMNNGEWIAHTNVCKKEKSRIHDLYIGRGSDGKWYYSTYHFCPAMTVLMMRADLEGQPASLAEFVKQYHLRQFDDQSDEALEKTWPPKRER